MTYKTQIKDVQTNMKVLFKIRINILKHKVGNPLLLITILNILIHLTPQKVLTQTAQSNYPMPKLTPINLNSNLNQILYLNTHVVTIQPNQTLLKDQYTQ